MAFQDPTSVCLLCLFFFFQLTDNGRDHLFYITKPYGAQIFSIGTFHIRRKQRTYFALFLKTHAGLNSVNQIGLALGAKELFQRKLIF